MLTISKYYGNLKSGASYARVILTEIYHLSGMKSFRDDLIARTKTGRGCFVLASNTGSGSETLRVTHLEKVWEDEAPHLLEVGRAPDLGALQQKGQRLGSSRPVRTQYMSTPNSVADPDPGSSALG